MRELKNYTYLVLAGVFMAPINIFSAVLRDLGYSAFQHSFFRAAVAATLFLMLMLFLRQSFRIPRKHIWIALAMGSLISLTSFLENIAIVLGTSVAVVIFLLYTQPIYSLVLGQIFLKERATRTQGIAVFLAIAGAFFLTKPWAAASIQTLLGPALVFVAAFLFGVYIFLGRSVARQQTAVLGSFLFYIFLFRAISVLFWGFLASKLTTNPLVTTLTFTMPLYVWLLLFGSGFLAVFMGHLLYMYGARSVSAGTAGTLLLTEPVVVAILGIIILNEVPTLFILFGGALVLSAVLLILRTAQHKRSLKK